jgi:peroxiredoxin
VEVDAEHRQVVTMPDPLPPAVGAEAPDFTIPDETGAPVRLDELCAPGRVVLVFYRGHW